MNGENREWKGSVKQQLCFITKQIEQDRKERRQADEKIYMRIDCLERKIFDPHKGIMAIVNNNKNEIGKTKVMMRIWNGILTSITAALIWLAGRKL